jgi:hypothetical protein
MFDGREMIRRVNCIALRSWELNIGLLDLNIEGVDYVRKKTTLALKTGNSSISSVM